MSAEKLAALKLFYPAAESLSESGQMVVFLPGPKVEAPQGQVEADALLHPSSHSGYATRLFVARQIEAPLAKNWTSHSLCGRTWWACSWQGVDAGLPWIDMIADHLRAFR